MDAVQEVSLEDRYVGALLGAIVAEVFGAQVEGLNLTHEPSEVEIKNEKNEYQRNFKLFIKQVIYGEHGGMVTEPVANPHSFFKHGEITDDGTQVLLTTESIVTCKRFDMDDIAKNFLVWHSHGEAKGMGSTTGGALSLMATLQASWRGAGKLAMRRGSVVFQRGARNPETAEQIHPSNGSVMRTLPIGMYFRDDKDQVAYYARVFSEMTHAFPDCVESCQLASELVADLLNGVDKETAIFNAAERYPRIYEAACAIPQQQKVHFGGAVTTLGIALDAFAKGTDYSDVVLRTLNPHRYTEIRDWGESWAGPDADTYAIVAGGFAGAAYGSGSIPNIWQTSINDRFSAGESPYDTNLISSLALAMKNLSLDRIQGIVDPSFPSLVLNKTP